MSFPRYPAYKPSGVEWLGEMPEHWQEKPLKTITSINDEVLPESLSLDYEIEYVDIGSVSLANGIEKTEAMPFGDAPSRARRIPRDGDVLVSTVRTYLKAIAPVVNPLLNLVAFTGFAVVRPGHELEPGFLKYALQEEHFIQQVISRSTGVSYPAINASDVAKISLNLPGSSEQLAIATFLDHETAKIDALIAEQQRLIGLLQEKRQAVISHAVTKGLNPDAPMKDSGVEWLGEVPGHWNQVKLRELATEDPSSFTNGPFGSDLLTSEFHDSGVPVVYIRDLNIDGYRHVSSNYITDQKAESLSRFSVNPGDILFSKVGDPPGYCCMYPEGASDAIICQDVIRLRPDADFIVPIFLCLLVNSVMGRELVESICVESTRKRFSLGDLKSLKVIIPPPEEQSAICAHVQKSTVGMEKLGCDAHYVISLLVERRSALISAAVTGQIDVRGLVPEAVAA